MSVFPSVYCVCVDGEVQCTVITSDDADKALQVKIRELKIQQFALSIKDELVQKIFADISALESLLDHHGYAYEGALPSIELKSIVEKHELKTSKVE